LYEQAKVEEARNTPSVIVLDKAGPAERKAKPKGTLYALVSFVSSFLIGLFIVFVREMFLKIKYMAPEKHSYILSSLKSDMIKLGFRKR